MRKLISIFVLAAAVLLPLSMFAQPGPPGGSGSTTAPIDGAAGILLVAAAAYGYKKLKGEKPLEEENTNV